MRCADTEGSFMVERVVEIADACIRHLKKLANNNGTAAQKDAVSTHPTPPHPTPPHPTPPHPTVHVHACLFEGNTVTPSVRSSTNFYTKVHASRCGVHEDHLL